MYKGIIIAAGLVVSLLASSIVHAAAYIRGASQPWEEATNEAAMDAAFGPGGWADLRMADGPGPFMPGSGHSFIFLEGGDDTALELAAYLDAHRAAIEAFVSNGGALLLNAAPNEGGNIDYGFGGVTLMYSGSEETSTVDAVDPAHPIFDGVVTTYTGNSFGHALVGPGLTPLIVGAAGDDNEGGVVLGEKPFGAGHVLLGGMTTDNFHDPQPDAATLRSNILQYTAATAIAGANAALPARPVPTLGLWQLALMSLLLAAFGAVGHRRLRG